MDNVSGCYSAETAKIAIALALALLKNKPPGYETKLFVEECADRLFHDDLSSFSSASSSESEDANGTDTTVDDSSGSSEAEDTERVKKLVMAPFENQRENENRRTRRSVEHQLALRTEIFTAIRQGLRLSDLIDMMSNATAPCGAIFARQLSQHFQVVQTRIEANDWESIQCVFAELCVLLESLPEDNTNHAINQVAKNFVKFVIKSALMIEFDAANKTKQKQKRRTKSLDRELAENRRKISRKLVFEMCETVNSPRFVRLVLGGLVSILSDCVVPQIIALLAACRRPARKRTNVKLIHCGLLGATLDSAGWLCLACHSLLAKRRTYFELSHSFRAATRESLAACKNALLSANPRAVDAVPLFINTLILLMTLCE